MPEDAKTNTILSDIADSARDSFVYAPARQPPRGGESEGSTTAPGTGGMAQLAESTIRQALGWRYRPGDVRGFSAALARAFSLSVDQEGRVSWKWTPQTYAVQADMGEITGAQASILEQARVTIEYIVPLVDGLKPLRVDSDADDIHRVTSIIRMKLKTILSELGRIGGPRVHRVDLVFEELLGLPIVKFMATTGTTTGADDRTVGARKSKDGKGGATAFDKKSDRWSPVLIPDRAEWEAQLRQLDLATPGGKKKAYSLLRQLTEEFGLKPNLANTVEEERLLTNAEIIIDSVIALRTAWIGKRDFFDRRNTSKRYLGTQLVLLSRQLSVVAESVREAYAAMDSVFFGPNEREATDIHFINFERSATDCKEIPGSETDVAPLTMGDLLDWVETFAAQEGPQLLQEGGKDGVLAFRATLARLTKWIAAAHDFSRDGDKERKGKAPASFFTSRVQRALGEIEKQLQTTSQLARGISRAIRPSAEDGLDIDDLPSRSGARVSRVGPERNGDCK